MQLNVPYRRSCSTRSELLKDADARMRQIAVPTSHTVVMLGARWWSKSAAEDGGRIHIVVGTIAALMANLSALLRARALLLMTPWQLSYQISSTQTCCFQVPPASSHLELGSMR